MKNKNVLIAGGAGFLGSHLCDLLVDYGYNVICLDNFYKANLDNLKVSYKLSQDKNIKLHDTRVDISDEKLMRDTFLRYRPQYVFHCASYLTLDSKENKSRSVQVNT